MRNNHFEPRNGNKSIDDNGKNISEMLAELVELRQRVHQLEEAEVKHKLTENELNNSQKMLQLILDTIPQGVFWKDRNFTYLGCNIQFAKDSGLENPDEITGKNDFELSWKDIAQLYRDDDKFVMESNTPKLNFEEPLKTLDGKKQWVRTNKIPLYDQDKNVIGILGTYEDITEKKQAEETLQHERILLRTLIDGLPDLIYVKDTECRKIVANLADVHNMGLKSEAEVIGKTDFELYPK